MFETSKDVLNLSLALGALVITALIAWLLFQSVKIISDIRKTTKFITKKISILDDILKILKDKIEKSSSYISILVDLVSKLVTHFTDYTRYNKTNAPTKPLKNRKVATVDIDEE